MRLADLRTKSIVEASYLLADMGERIPVLTSWQLAALKQEAPRNAYVIVPDFLRYARMLASGRAMAVTALPESKNEMFWSVAKTAGFIARHPLRLLKKDFWLVAEALLRYDISLMPSDYEGRIMLHSYLADIAFAFEKREFLNVFFSLAAGRKPGIHTQQLPQALTCLAKWGLSPSVIVHANAFDKPWSMPEVAKQSDLYQFTEVIQDFSYLPPLAQRQKKIGMFSV